MGQKQKVKALATKILDDVQALTYYHVAVTANVMQVTKALGSIVINTP